LLNLIANTVIEKAVYEVLNPVVSEKGLKIVKIQFHNSKKSKLLIFIDKDQGKLTVDECGDISTEINSILDVENIIKDSFRLEVSSAGIDRYLTSSEDFMRYQNCNVKVTSENSTERGKLIRHGSNSLTLSNKNGEKSIDLSSVLDIKIDLEGMSLETIKEMEFK
tara:strand:- start:9 stop:503 length:495 start_codon:yes stop_codon:yes gene_type:complete